MNLIVILMSTVTQSLAKIVSMTKKLKKTWLATMNDLLFYKRTFCALHKTNQVSQVAVSYWIVNQL